LLQAILEGEYLVSAYAGQSASVPKADRSAVSQMTLQPFGLNTGQGVI
jgi:hypothetical protein